MTRVSKDAEAVNFTVLRNMALAALEGVYPLSETKPGDETLLDTLAPASQVLMVAVEKGAGFKDGIDMMITAAKKGWRSTEAMAAKAGRAARIGERSKGILDAGATSCFLILKSIGTTIKEELI